MAKKIQPQKVLEKKLQQYYTQDEIDQFAWYPDEDGDYYYRFVFHDHLEHKKRLILDKEHGSVSLMSA